MYSMTMMLDFDSAAPSKQVLIGWCEVVGFRLILGRLTVFRCRELAVIGQRHEFAVRLGCASDFEELGVIGQEFPRHVIVAGNLDAILHGEEQEKHSKH
mmetsp:Transcript_28944/g.58782  ORF Transcript_28944/g.58782 Transcript_28944/m.58782 type:complete len:99 (-) Transcript_28944:312-608(-)